MGAFTLGWFFMFRNFRMRFLFLKLKKQKLGLRFQLEKNQPLVRTNMANIVNLK